MSKGTKHKADWKETTLQVVIDAKRLYCHSVKIMGNEKVFKPVNDFRGATLMTVHETLLDVYVKTWEANRINVSRHPELADERLALQRFAIADCHRLLALFELVKSQFHVPAAKFWNWMNMLAEVGLTLHPRKTRVVTADEGGLFPGFRFRVTSTGKVLMLRDPAKVKDIRRRLRRLAALVRKGRRTAEDFENCYGCIRACLSEGNSARLVRNMDNYANELRRTLYAA